MTHVADSTRSQAYDHSAGGRNILMAVLLSGAFVIILNQTLLKIGRAHV